MLKGLARKLATLSVLIVTLAAVFAAPARAEPQCFVCVCDNGRCQCVRVPCP